MERGEITSWTTPTIHETKTRTELIANGGRFIRGYDPLTGKELWRFSDDNTQVKMQAPLGAHDLIFITGGYPAGRAMYAFRSGRLVTSRSNPVRRPTTLLRGVRARVVPTHRLPLSTATCSTPAPITACSVLTTRRRANSYIRSGCPVHSARHQWLRMASSIWQARMAMSLW